MKHVLLTAATLAAFLGIASHESQNLGGEQPKQAQQPDQAQKKDANPDPKKPKPTAAGPCDGICTCPQFELGTDDETAPTTRYWLCERCPDDYVVGSFAYEAVEPTAVECATAAPGDCEVILFRADGKYTADERKKLKKEKLKKPKPRDARFVKKDDTIEQTGHWLIKFPTRTQGDVYAKVFVLSVRDKTIKYKSGREKTIKGATYGVGCEVDSGAFGLSIPEHGVTLDTKFDFVFHVTIPGITNPVEIVTDGKR